MLQMFFNALLLSTLLTVPAVHAGAYAEPLCALPTASLVGAASQFADCSFALDEVKKYAIATWFTDRETVDSCAQKLKDIVATCDESSRMTLVVYGLPNKDCDAGYSSGGFNKNAEDYKQWVQKLADSVGQRKVLYVLEPDAVGLLAKGGCGVQNGYADNVKAALEILSKNPNADIYLDVGYWTLMSESDAAGIAKTVKELAAGGRLKGISLNTSNYRSNQEISNLCGNFQKAYGDKSMNCVVDTSRNYNDSPKSSEWCNAKFGGIGRPPTAQTGFDNLDYFIWIKPAGESDGTCDGGDHTADAMKGPAAGSFFKDHFVHLWNNGYFVKEQNYPLIDGTVRTPAPTNLTPVTQAAVNQEPATPAPTSTSPETQGPTTPAPTTAAPITQAPATQGPVTSAPTSAPSNSPVESVTVAPVTTPDPTTPEISSGPVEQYPSTTSAPVASTESRVIENSPAPTPAATDKKKKKRSKHKKCDSGLEPTAEDIAAEKAAVAAAKDAATKSTTVKVAAKEESTLTTVKVDEAVPVSVDNSTAKALSFSTKDEEPHDAPPVAAGDSTQSANTQGGSDASSGFGGGAVAAVMVAAVAVIAVAAVALRRRSEQRRRAETLHTPVETFGQLNVTPAQVTIL